MNARCIIKSAFSFVIMVLILCPGITGAESLKKLFIIHSYEKGHICGQPQHDGVVKVLSDLGWIEGKNIELSAYYMDTKRKNNTKALIARQAELAHQAIDKFQPDVIVTLDDNAFKTVALPLSGKPVSIVFSGMNGQPEAYNQSTKFMENRKAPGGNITGVYEKLHIREAIHVLATMHPMEKILVLDDLSPTGKAIAKQVELELQPESGKGSLPCLVEQRTILSWEEFKQTIEEVNAISQIGAFYLGTLLLKDSSGNTYTAKDIIDYTIANARKPAVGLNYAFIKLGLYGGASVDFFAMGKQAGEKVALIFNGTSPGNLSIDDAQKIALVFNLARSESLGIEIPPDILMAADEVFRK